MNSPKYITDLARSIRRDMTPAERTLWARLRRKRIGGYRFRRQHPVGRYIADFCCPEVKLIVELDGAIHNTREAYDVTRDAFLSGGGFTLLRFTNEAVERSLDSVLETIRAKAEELK